MAARLPKPGEDHATWGHILNDFLTVSLADDGVLKTGTVGEAQLQDDSVGLAKLAPDVRSLLAPLGTQKGEAATASTLAATGVSALSVLYYAPEDYGCAVGALPAVNDTAIAAAITDASAGNGVVRFTGKGPYSVSQAVEQDVSKVVVHGVDTMLDVVDTFSGYYFWHMFSSADYPYSYNLGVALKGIILQGAGLGATPINSTALRIGDRTYLNNSLFAVEQVYVQGWSIGIGFMSNAWRVRLSDCRVTGGTALSVPAGLTNFGENMLVENCMFESYNALVSIGTGEWSFINSSFDSCLISAVGNCSVKLQNSHIEPHTVFPCVDVAHAQAMITLDNVTLVIDPNVVINDAAFNVVSSNKTYGLIIRNLDTIQSANYTPQVNSQNCVLVSGGGRVDIKGYSSNANGYGYAIATSNNLLHNGDAEKGSTAGWTTYASYGGPSTFGVDTTTKKNGSYALKLTVSNGSTYVGQAVPCLPGQWVFAQCWNKLNVDSGTGNTSIALDYLNAKGEVILTTGYTNITKTTYWTCRNQLTGTTPVAPAGTASVRVYIALTGTGSATAWYDDIIVNTA